MCRYPFQNAEQVQPIRRQSVCSLGGRVLLVRLLWTHNSLRKVLADCKRLNISVQWLLYWSPMAPGDLMWNRKRHKGGVAKLKVKSVKSTRGCEKLCCNGGWGGSFLLQFPLLAFLALCLRHFLIYMRGNKANKLALSTSSLHLLSQISSPRLHVATKGWGL